MTKRKTYVIDCASTMFRFYFLNMWNIIIVFKCIRITKTDLNVFFSVNIKITILDVIKKLKELYDHLVIQKYSYVERNASASYYSCSSSYQWIHKYDHLHQTPAPGRSWSMEEIRFGFIKCNSGFISFQVQIKMEFVSYI